jgi:hypothetical protein
MATKKSDLISEGDCPFCGTAYVFDDADRSKDKVLCSSCGKSYKIERSKNIVLKDVSAAPAVTPAAPPPVVPVVPVVATTPAAAAAPVTATEKPPTLSSRIAPFIMIPLSIFLGWVIFNAISTTIETPTDVNVTPVLSNIDQCYLNAYNAMMDNWVGYCRINNIKVTKDENGKDTCNTPASYAEDANAIYIANKALCVARYK